MFVCVQASLCKQLSFPCTHGRLVPHTLASMQPCPPYILYAMSSSTSVNLIETYIHSRLLQLRLPGRLWPGRRRVWAVRRVWRWVCRAQENYFKGAFLVQNLRLEKDCKEASLHITHMCRTLRICIHPRASVHTHTHTHTYTHTRTHLHILVYTLPRTLSPCSFYFSWCVECISGLLLLPSFVSSCRYDRGGKHGLQRFIQR